MGKNKISWAPKGRMLSEAFGFDELETKATGLGENRYCPTVFSLGEVITFPDTGIAEYFMRPFKKLNGDIDHVLMIKCHSSVRGEFFVEITAFLRTPIEVECAEFFKDSPLQYHLLKVCVKDIERARFLVGKTFEMYQIDVLHKAGWITLENGDRVSSTKPEDIQPLNCWCFREIE
jgi:hypothetical protein